ncbi:pre-mRNA-splicing factor prp46 [Komagataella kurtzmanii]|nr:pre-mRNA-splicing factor prp46 [Komagataella kurtzmanii]
MFSESVTSGVDLLEKRTKKLFGVETDPSQIFVDDNASSLYSQTIIEKQYRNTQSLPEYLEAEIDREKYGESSIITSLKEKALPDINRPSHQAQLVLRKNAQDIQAQQLIKAQAQTAGLYSHMEKPEWHAPWKLMRVIVGHTGWVRSVAVEPENKWFATGSADRTIKVWDLVSGKLKLTLTGHIMAVRGLVISDRHPYLFSGSEDKTVKCWDLEKNQIIRDYHGHLSSVYSVDLHPTIDIIATAGRDSVVRVWDIRSRTPIQTLTGHTSTITNVKCLPTDPQIISTSMDGTVRLYDLVAGKCMKTLTHHRKAVRGMCVHPQEYAFATASSDSIRQWKLPKAQLLNNCAPVESNKIINTLSVNQKGVLFSGADDGTLGFFDWRTGHQFQAAKNEPTPGSLDSESAVLASTFDNSGLRLITCTADKTIKIWKEDEMSTPETDPGLPWDPTTRIID